MINIKLSYLKILIILSVLFILSLLNMIFFDITNVYIIGGFFLLLIVILKYVLGYEKDRNRFKKDALMNIFIYVMIYHIATYVIGIFIGFVRTIYDLSFLNILQNVLPVLFVIVVVEILRYMINKKVDNNKWLLLFSTIVFITIELMIVVSLYTYRGADLWLTILALAVLPAITKNIMLNYMSINFGFMPNILYRILFEIPLYLLPIFPNFNEYLNAVLGFVFPLIILFLMYRDIIKKRKKGKKEVDSSRSKHIISKIISLVLIFFTIIMVVLTSGIYTHFSLSIGSGSMTPVLNVGDVVVVEKVEIEEVSSLKEKDILVYEKDDILVVHRIESINKIDDEITFVTKGDNNNDLDNWVVTDDMVLGKVNFVIPFIGYPTIWVNDLIE